VRSCVGCVSVLFACPSGLNVSGRMEYADLHERKFLVLEVLCPRVIHMSSTPDQAQKSSVTSPLPHKSPAALLRTYESICYARAAATQASSRLNQHIFFLKMDRRLPHCPSRLRCHTARNQRGTNDMGNRVTFDVDRVKPTCLFE
jgi:hypothetical protein